MTGARIYFEVFDETAADEAAFSSTLAQPWVDYGSLTDGLYPDDDPENPTLRQFVTGEPNAASLGGSVRLFPDSPGASLGYWSSNLSGADGAFAAPPVLVCGFGGTAHTSVGVTVYFDLHACLSDFKVEWLSSSGTALATQTVTGNTAPSVFIEEHVEEYYGLRITCQKTADPYRYAKIQEIEFGQRMVYDEHNLVSASAVEEVDLSGASTPAGSLQLHVFDPDGRLNPVNPDGIYTYLRRGMPLHVEFIVDNVRYPGGLYYLDTWEGSNTGTAKITAMDIIGFRSSFMYASAFHPATSPVTADAIFSDIYDVCGLSGQVYTGVGSGTYIGYIPEADMQQAIAHACLACGGYAKAVRDGRVDIIPPPSTASPIILTQRDILGEPDVSKSKPITQVEVEEYSYSVSSSTDYSESPRIWLGQELEYYRYDLDGVYSDVDTWLESEIGSGSYHQERIRCCASFVEFYALAESSPPPTVAFIQGRTVTETKVLHRTDGGEKTDGVVSIKGIPLITRDKSGAVISRAKEYYAKQLTIKARTVWRNGLECGACVTVPTRFGTVTGNITRMDINLAGGMLATMEVIA